jgi:hypothetical protein
VILIAAEAVDTSESMARPQIAAMMVRFKEDPLVEQPLQRAIDDPRQQ